MLTRKTILVTFMGFICFLIFIGCDHTDLTGQVTVESKEIYVGDEVPMVLEVPEELSEIHGVFWDIEPDDMGVILFNDELIEAVDTEKLNQLFGKDDINYERVAVFYPKKAGKVKIFIDGFFRQTNPQGITEIQIEVK